MDNTTLFTGKASIYAAARPDYAPDLTSWLLSRGFGAGFPVADIGAGTGIFSRLLLHAGCEVFAVEPNDDMRAACEAALTEKSRLHIIKGAADATGLPDHSVEAVTVAQAFHWFDPLAFRAECQRILKPGGIAYLIWNNRISSHPLVQENAAVCREFCPTFHGFSGADRDQSERMQAFFSSYEQAQFPNDITYDEQSFIDRNLSSSYTPAPDAPSYMSFVGALRALFQKYAVRGELTLPNETAVYFGTV